MSGLFSSIFWYDNRRKHDIWYDNRSWPPKPAGSPWIEKRTVPMKGHALIKQGRSTTAVVSRGGVWVESYGREWYHSRTRLPNDPKYDTEVRTGAFEDNR